MSSQYRCPQCAAVEWIRLENILVDSEQKAIQGEESGILKCANCGVRVSIGSDDKIEMVQTASQQPISRPRVRSSVSAAERGLDPTDRRGV